MLRLSGDFDLLGVEPYHAELERAIAVAAERGLPLVIDLRGLSFMDSSGLRAMLNGHSRHGSGGVEMHYLQPSENLWRVFTVTGSDRLLPFDDGLAAAVGAPPAEQDS